MAASATSPVRPALAPAAERVVAVDERFDLGLTLAPLRHWARDPTIRLGRGEAWRATRTPAGPATERLVHGAGGISVAAWGPGAEWLLEAAPELLGARDEADAGAFRPSHPLVRELQRRFAGLRLCRTRAVVESLLPAVAEQKVSGPEAHLAWWALLQQYGEPAPGPGARLGLRVPPAASTLARLPSYALHPSGLERKRAETIRRACERAERLEALVELAPEAGRERLAALPGIGPWTAAEVAVRAFGDADAVSVGDYHLPRLVCAALAGEAAGDDARMLELLEPYRGQRARVIRLLELGVGLPPRRAPRAPLRRLATI
ncbi:MAG TPA: hypothetical protein VF763_02510 [Candidatus Limnocylindrales bacterium]